MSNELKAYRFVLATENSSLGGVVYNSNYVYAKDDVDELIAKKDEEIKNLKRSLIVARHAVANARGKNVSHKYRTKVGKFKEAK